MEGNPLAVVTAEISFANEKVNPLGHTYTA
jgi:hypothetical protein